MVSACYRAELGFSSKKGFPKMIKVVVLLKVWWSLPEINALIQFSLCLKNTNV